MGSIDQRLKRLEERINIERLELVCGVCGKEITVAAEPSSAVWIDLELLDWNRTAPAAEDYPDSRYDPGLIELYEHEHDAKAFRDNAKALRDKRTGLRFYEPVLTGVAHTAGFYEDSPEDPSQSREDSKGLHNPL